MIRATESGLPSDRHRDRIERAVVLEAVKAWPGNSGACRKGLVRRPTLTVSVRASGKRGAGRDEETGSQIEQRNRSRKQEREIAALKPLDNEKPIQAMVVNVAEKSGHDPVRHG